MKTVKIAYHLERALKFKTELDLGPPRRAWGRNVCPHAAYVRHTDIAAQLLAEGLREFAALSDDPKAAYRRRYRARQPKGPGRGQRGKKWGCHLNAKKDVKG